MEGRQEDGVHLLPRRTVGRGAQRPVRCVRGARMCICWAPRHRAGGEAYGALLGVQVLLFKRLMSLPGMGGPPPSLAHDRQRGPEVSQLCGSSCKVTLVVC